MADDDYTLGNIGLAVLIAGAIITAGLLRRDGWVRSARQGEETQTQVSESVPVAAVEEAPQVAEPAPERRMVRGSSTVGVRARPGGGTRVVRVRAGAVLTFVRLSVDGKWTQIRTRDGTEGWIQNGDLETPRGIELHEKYDQASPQESVKARRGGALLDMPQGTHLGNYRAGETLQVFSRVQDWAAVGVDDGAGGRVLGWTSTAAIP